MKNTNIIENAINAALQDTNKKDYYNFTYEDSIVNIYIANLNAYNSGRLFGAWLSLPATESQIKKVFELLKFDSYDNEFAIHDFESDLGIEIKEYTNIYDLNTLVDEISDLDEYDIEVLKAHIEATGDDIKTALERYQNDIYYSGAELIDVAYDYVENSGVNIPDFIANYIDYEAIARDLRFDGYTETENGVIYIG